MAEVSLIRVSRNNGGRIVAISIVGAVITANIGVGYLLIRTVLGI